MIELVVSHLVAGCVGALLAGAYLARRVRRLVRAADLHLTYWGEWPADHSPEDRFRHHSGAQ